MFNFLNKKRVVYNLGYDGTNKRKALLSYTFDASCKPAENFSFSTNRNECLIILKKLIDAGFIVDFVDCDNEIFSSENKYDLVIGFGFPYRNALTKDSGVKILYCTEQHPDYSYKSEVERIEYLKVRRSIKWSIERSGTYYVHNDFLIADKIIVISDLCYDYLLEHRIKNELDLAVIYPTGIEPKYIKSPYLDYGKDFIWFGSRGVIHKGLDILIESFILADLDCSLHICGASKKDILFLGDILNDERIIFHGTIDVQSNLFFQILESSSFVVSLSCSESNSTGVLTCMRHGLIPVVTKSTAIDVSTCGYELINHEVSFIQAELKKISDIELSELIRLRLELIHILESNYNLNSFSNSFSILIKNLDF